MNTKLAVLIHDICTNKQRKYELLAIDRQASRDHTRSGTGPLTFDVRPLTPDAF